MRVGEKVKLLRRGPGVSRFFLLVSVGLVD